MENKEDILGDYLKLYCYYINKEQKLVVMYLELIFNGIKAESWKVAEVRLSSQELKEIRKIVYPGIETSKKACSCQGWSRRMRKLKLKKLQGKDCLPTHWSSQEILLMHGLSLVREIVYPEIKAGRKDWICRDWD